MSSDHTVVVGIDEAGLGPMLGPLCIGAVAMEVPNHLLHRNVWQLLAEVVSQDHRQKARRLVVCDSKKLHSSAKGIAPLEEAVFPFLTYGAEQAEPFSLSGLLKLVCPVGELPLKGYPWYEDSTLSFPLAANAERASIRAGMLARECKAQGLQLLAVRALPVVVGEFNRLAELHASKADVDLASMVVMIEEMLSRWPVIRVFCDRLGGRSFYAASLEAHLKPERVVVVHESEEYSEYHVFRTRHGREEHLHISFEVEADDRHFVTALASMAAKYLREAMMESFNAWFSKHDPALKPTKGYVQDARRWLNESIALRRSLGIPDEILIRSK